MTKKVTAYKQEKVRIQKAIQDSLAALNNLKNDSTLTANNIVTSDTLENVEDVVALEEENNENKDGLVGPPGNDVLGNRNQTVVTSKKKLEPLWDPRKHFN